MEDLNQIVIDGEFLVSLESQVNMWEKTIVSPKSYYIDNANAAEGRITIPSESDESHEKSRCDSEWLWIIS